MAVAVADHVFTGRTRNPRLLEFEASSTRDEFNLKSTNPLGQDKLKFEWTAVRSLTVCGLPNECTCNDEVQRCYVIRFKNPEMMPQFQGILTFSSELRLYFRSNKFGLNLLEYLLSTGSLFALGTGSFRYALLEPTDLAPQQREQARPGFKTVEDPISGEGLAEFMDSINRNAIVFYRPGDLPPEGSEFIF